MSDQGDEYGEQDSNEGEGWDDYGGSYGDYDEPSLTHGDSLNLQKGISSQSQQKNRNVHVSIFGFKDLNQILSNKSTSAENFFQGLDLNPDMA